MDASACIFNAESGKVLYKLNDHSDHVTCLAFSFNGEKFGTTSLDKTAIIYNLSTGEIEHRLSEHE